MRFFQIGQARAAPADRNQITTGATSETLGVAPHATTTRISYTVPAAKKALLTSCGYNLTRATAAAPVGRWSCIVFITNLLATNLYLLARYSYGNTVGDSIFQDKPITHTLLAGEQIRANTTDASTGGTLDITTFATVQEHDA